MLNTITDAKEFDSVRRDQKRHDNMRHIRKKMVVNCKYCSTGQPWQDVYQLWQNQSFHGSVQNHAETVARPEVIKGWQVSI